MTINRNPETIHPPVGTYAHHVEIPAGSRWLVMSGQIGREADGRVPEDPMEQLQVACENVRRNLEAGGMEVKDIAKITWYFVAPIDDRRRRELIAEWLDDHRPATTLVYVAALAAPEYRVEVDAWAAR